jgi:hypothetical protein
MSSSVVRQLVATVGFVGVAVLVGMPVRAQQVVLTPACNCCYHNGHERCGKSCAKG